MADYRPETYGDRVAEVYDTPCEGLDTEAAVETLASPAGAGPVLRRGGWAREAFTSDSPRHVSVYSR